MWMKLGNDDYTVVDFSKVNSVQFHPGPRSDQSESFVVLVFENGLELPVDMLEGEFKDLREKLIVLQMSSGKVSY